jgi:hypothetical protein
MNSRLSSIALVALCLFAAPVALAQGPLDAESGQIGYGPRIGVGGAVSRTFTDALLTTPDGAKIGKVKTATVVAASGTLQAVRVTVSGLTPNTEYALVIDNTLVGTATTTASGVLKMRFSDPARRSDRALPEAIRPIAQAQTVAIYEVSSQRLVASGQFASGPVK